MSSLIPTRRLGRTTRTTSNRDNENANARPSRIATRMKPPSATSTNAITGGVTRATAASRAKTAGVGDAKADLAPQGKRKREALGEVTSLVTNNKSKNGAVDPEDENIKPIKGKDKEPKEKTVVTRKTATATHTAVEPRKPLRTVLGQVTRPATRSTTVAPKSKPVQKVKNEPKVAIHEDNAMAIDPAANPIVEERAPATRQVTTRRARLEQTTADAVARHSEIYRRSSKLVAQEQLRRLEKDVEEVEPVCKKLRTSSEPPEEVEEKRLNEAHDEVEAYSNEEPEADPEGDQWYDIDAEDADDPLMASEYVVDIVKYMRVLEAATMPNPTYMHSQRELAWKMRGVLNDWLVAIHVRFRLLPETLFLAINIIDRFLSARVVSLAKLQLVGVTCMFVASKVEETCSPSVSAFLYCADRSYTKDEILQAERYILKTLEYNLSYPNPVHFLRRVSKADDYDVTARTVAKYLLEIPCLDWRLLAAPPSLIAAAAIWFARIVLARDQWTPNLAHYSGYAESSLVHTANLMLNYVLRPIKHDSFYKKYAGRRFLKSSVYLRQWALKRWDEGTFVDLKAELPRLKAEIKEMKENWAAGVSEEENEA